MYKFSKYRDEYKENLKLAIPIMLAQLGHIVLQLADTSMVGIYGGNDPTPLAAAAFGGGLFFIAMVSTMALTFGLTPLIGELYAQRRHSEPAKLLQNAVVLYCGIGAVVTAILFAIIPFMEYMGQPADVVELAIPYYKTLVWSLIPVVVFFVFKQFLEGLGNTKAAMYMVLGTNLFNIILNYILIWGVLGLPEMGVLGAGLATCLTRVLLAVVMVIYFFGSKDFKSYRDKFARCNFSRRAVAKLLDMGLPITTQVFLESTTFICVGFMFGWFDKVAISANQICYTLSNCSFSMVIAIGSATTIRISHCYGLRDAMRMRRASKAAWHLAIVWNLFIASLYFSMREVLPHIFTSNSEVIDLASMLLVATAAYQLSDGLQCVSAGILRGMQDVRVIPVIALFAYWVCNLPIGYICAFHLGMGPRGLYTGFFVGLTLAAILMYVRIKRRQMMFNLKGM